jgi:hypothetical protein
MGSQAFYCFEQLSSISPTVTPAYYGGTAINSEEDFVTLGGYEEKRGGGAWSPKYGYACQHHEECK